MKKTILSIATVLMMGLGAFAGTNNLTGTNDEVNQQAVRSFNKEFSSARNITWEQRQDYVKATFTLNGQVMFAYYNNNGDLQAVVRNIVSLQLPIGLLTDLKKEYSGFWISELFETVSDDQTSYYVTLENADKKILLKSVGTEGWYVFAKTKKDAE